MKIVLRDKKGRGEETEGPAQHGCGGEEWRKEQVHVWNDGNGGASTKAQFMLV